MITASFWVDTIQWIRRYALLTILLSILVWDLGNVALFGMEPRPQLPLDGYEVERGTVTLQWKRADTKNPVHLQIAKDPEFEDVVVDITLNASTYNFSDNLERGTRYYWRVTEQDKVSRTAWFDISPQHVHL